jgi:hypothetical protein
MWKPIEDNALVEALAQGQVIAIKVDEKFEKYEVRSIQSNGYITALHVDGKIEIKIFPVEELLLEWWIEIENK